MSEEKLLEDFLLFMKKVNGENCKELTGSEKDWIRLFLGGKN